MPDSASEKKKRRFGAFDLFLLIELIALVIVEFFPPRYAEEETLNTMLSVIVSRTVGAAFFLPMLFRLRYRVHGTVKMPLGWALAAFLPALAVCVNNFPWIGFLGGAVTVTAPRSWLWVYVLESLCIGLLEETAFRGVLYMAILEDRRRDSKQIFWATVAASAIFGCVHLFNLFAGAGFGGTILQVGYSFLIGGLCSIVLLRTGNLWLCVLLHAVYDFGGFFVETLGEGRIWDPVTVTLTAVLGVLAALWLAYVLWRTTPESIAGLFPEPKKTNIETEKSEKE